MEIRLGHRISWDLLQNTLHCSDAEWDIRCINVTFEYKNENKRLDCSQDTTGMLLYSV